MPTTRIPGTVTSLAAQHCRRAAVVLSLGVALGLLAGPAAAATESGESAGPAGPMGGTVTTLTSTAPPSPSSFGQNVVFNYSVVAGAGGPPCSNPNGGTIQLVEGVIVHASATVPGVLQTSLLSLGSHTLFLRYLGNAGTNCDPSSSAAFGYTVNPAGTSTTLVSSLNPSVFGQAVTFTATVTGGGSPTGTVTFDDGTTVLATRILDGAGQASFTTSLLAVATHPMRAVYHGDANHTGSQSANLNQVVNKAGTNVALSRSPASDTVYGQFVTFTANLTAVGPGAGTPSGVVLFQDNGSTIGIGFLDGTGTASFATSALVVGAHPIKAVYGGDASFSGGMSSTLNHTVNKADTTVTLTRTTNVPFPANPSKFGQTVILTAAVAPVAPGGGLPVGTVTFKDGANSLGTVDLNPDGSATFQTSALAVGGHTLSAEYSGSANHNGSTSANMAHTVQKADTTVAVTDPAHLSSYAFGESFLLSAQLSVVAPGAGAPTGEVRFKFVNNATSAVVMFGGNAYVAAPVAPSGVAQTTIPLTDYPNAAGYTLTASYVGDSNFNASPNSAGKTVTIVPATTTIAVSSSLNPSVFGQAIAFVATVSVSSPGSMVPATTDANKVPTGQVQLTITPTVGPPVVVLGNLSLVSGVPFNGTVQITPPALAVDTYSVQAQYLPGANPNFLGSTSSTLSQTVNKANTTTSLTAAPNPSLSGQSVALTAQVAVLLPGAGTPTGNVTFKNGGVNIAGCVAVPLAGLQAVCNASFGTGAHILTAHYNGDTNFNLSASGGLTQNVTLAPTTVSLTDASVPLVTLFGQPATFDVTVSATSGTPAGTVAFRRAGVVISGCGAVALAGGMAQCVTSALPAGDNPISAVFTPTSDHAGGTSNTVFHTVAGAATTTALTRTPNASTVFGQPVTFQATVSSASGTPTGTVVFKADGITFAQQSLVAGVASFTISSLAVGNRTITAVYLGNASFAGSTGTLAHTVNPASTTTTVSSTPNPSVFGQQVVFTAQVTAVAPGTGVPTGMVTFKDGATTLGMVNLNGTGQATFSTTALSVGGHAITADYAGDGSYAASSGSLPTQTVNPAATTTTVTASPSPSLVGAPVTFTAVVAPAPPGAGTPTGLVTFQDGVTNITGCVGVALAGGQATCTTSALALGPHTINALYAGSGSFLASNGSVAHTVSNSPVDLAVTKTSTPNPVQAGTDLTYLISIQNLSTTGTSVVLNDPLPAQVTFVSATVPAGWACTDPGVGNSGTVNCTAALLPAMTSATITVVVHVPLDTPAGTLLVNTAAVSGGLPDPNMANNISTNETSVYRFRRP